MNPDQDLEGFLVEFTPVGSSVKVCAVDPLTGLEAVIVGSSLTPSHLLANAAVRKLKALLGRADAAADAGQGEERSMPAAPARRGLIV
ncbi:MAG TPA: hypothetical protein VIG90_09495 [Pedomonas sp.]|uniref:DUF6898 family protein n=1 Tax=Pedomonas sp. TaxID=2976421 RepID=UPI002F3E26FE